MWWRHAARFARTIRHLRLRQIGALAVRRVRGLRMVRLDVGDREPAPRCRWPADAPFQAPAGAHDPASVLAGDLTFLNRREPVGFPPDWNRTDLPRLWCYHLHYHEFLQALPFERARDAALDWMARHPRGRDRVGWEPYPTSLRLGVWCTYFFGRHRTRTVSDAAFAAALWRSIREQAQHLKANLERHLLGNHLLENAVALTLAGSCFDHAASRAWFDRGRTLLVRELSEQVLPDGGHVERSPMYQCRMLYALLLLRGTGLPDLGALVRPHLRRCGRALATMTHPDGRIALLNDSAFGTHPEPRWLAEQAGVPSAGAGSFALADSGYYGARTRGGHYVICDAGPLGPDHQPGHGHADLLSFELSLRGTRVVVDAGVSTYEAGPLREYCRSTRAHNTVEIEGLDQAELWAAFRVGRRPRPHGVVWTPLDGGFELSARHDGYRWLAGRPRHARRFRWCGDRGLEIDDRVDAARPVRSVARLHFHPSCRLGDLGDGAGVVEFPGGRAGLSWSGWDTVAEDESFYCPAFGVAQRNRCLAFSGVTANLRGLIRIGPV